MRTGIDAAYDHCQEITRREAKNFYYGFMLLPNGQRRAIYSAYAFARTCDDIVDAGLPRYEAAAQLELCRIKLARCLTGRPENPVYEALGRTIEKYGIPQEYFEQLISGVEMDLTKTRYATFEELETYCYHVASVVGLISIEIFGYDGSEEARRYAGDLGIALQLTNILRDIAEDAERGRIYLPLDELEWFGCSEEDVLAGRATPEFRRLIAFQADRARHYYSQGRRLLAHLPARARACVGVMAGIYSSILDDIERDPGVVFRRRVSLSGRQKLALAGKELVRSVVS
ncbi:MAG: presqualene diphosphate synthase HpnD [Chloroflexota bacterium]